MPRQVKRTGPMTSLSGVPSVDRVLRAPATRALIDEFGRSNVAGAARAALELLRLKLKKGASPDGTQSTEEEIVEIMKNDLRAFFSTSLVPVFNLTGTILHTNLGRAPLPPEAISAMADVAGNPTNLEFDLKNGRRGDRNTHIEKWLMHLTGAEAVTVVNNNAAALLLALNSLALRREVPVSRGELIEIGGSFRLPDIIARAGCKLVEVGTTNRTHLEDYAKAIGPRTGTILKVHTSNYVINGFTAAVPEPQLARLASKSGLPFIVDLGSGTLVDLVQFGLPPEPTVKSVLEAGADLVTFSGDKLLGGPQAGLIAGRADLVARVKQNPLMRALRVDKLTLAALGAVLKLYLNPERLVERIPAISLMRRSQSDIEILARRIAPEVERRVGMFVSVEVIPCMSQVGSGSLPVDQLPSFALRLAPKHGQGISARKVAGIAAAFRSLSTPVIGRIKDGAFWLDLRCLNDETLFLSQLEMLDLPRS